MMAKFINPILLFDEVRRKHPGSMMERIRSAWRSRNSRLENQVVEKTTDSQPNEIRETPASEIRKTIHGSVVTFEGTYLGKPIRVRIFNDAPQKSIDI
jgi:hypothetical protein